MTREGGPTRLKATLRRIFLLGCGAALLSALGSLFIEQPERPFQQVPPLPDPPASAEDLVAKAPKGVEMGKPLFSCGYVNSAWKKIDFGHVLDDQGRLWFYDIAGKKRSLRPDSDGLYLGAELSERYSRAVLEPRRVSPEQLAAMRKKAELARDGRIKTESGVTADAGFRGCSAYLWETPERYKRVSLGSSGDMTTVNSSPEAGELTKWLTIELGMGVHPGSRRQ